MRIEPDVVIRENVRNQSSRNGVKPVLIAVHSTAGANIPGSARDLRGVVGWFDNPQAQASSHVIVDGDGQSARCVPDDRKAWTQAFWNPWCLSIENIGQGGSHVDPHAEIVECARWIALWHERHGIPVRKGAVTRDGRITRTGVVRHSELGNLGGGHPLCPGSGYDLAECLKIARRIANR